MRIRSTAPSSPPGGGSSCGTATSSHDLVTPMTAEADNSSSPEVSVVLPCLNEEESVGLCVAEAREACEAAGLTVEVVVVDNGSTDDSVAVAVAAGARVVTERRRGYGSALRAGIEAARGCVVVMADADFTYPLGRVPELVGPVLTGDADLVLGTRLDAATRKSMPWLHRFVGTPILTFLVKRAAGGAPVTDSQSGFRAFRRDAVAALELRSTGMEFASEMLIKAIRHGWRVREIKMGYRPRIGASKLNTFADGARHLGLIVLLAPDLLLVGPGALVASIGAALTAWTFADPQGLMVGSLQWQPVFLSPILLVLGVQSLLGGVVLAHRSSLVHPSIRHRFRMVGSPGFSVRCLWGGLAGAATGLAIDLVLFVVWVRDDATAVNGPAWASLAQSLLILGSTVALFGLVSRLLFLRRRDFEGFSAVWRETGRANDRQPEMVASTPGPPAGGGNDDR